MPKSKTSKKKKTAKGGTGPSADVPADVVPTSELVAEAEAFAEQFDYDNAVRVLCQALTQEPDVPQTLEMLADMLMHQGDNEQAKQSLARSIQLAPESPDAASR
jgi:cytochrome c-type biogenesis protein CcmH/NrfG